LQPSWIQDGADGHNFERGPSKDHSDKVWLKLAKWFSNKKIFKWFFAYLCRICIIGQNRQKFKVHKKFHNNIKKLTILCLYSSNLGTFWFKIKQFWPFEEISIFSNCGHLGWRAWLSDKILKGTHTGTIPAMFGLIWFSGFRGEDLNVIFYQNMPNLHNRLKKKFHTKTSNIC
jgi:hypothetical protein